ncbi:MAG: tetratricopeptide repeat protein [Planctomycetota bacterium]|nr:tetratricopeptide repeat protein [Planctomycetota bacterium]
MKHSSPDRLFDRATLLGTAMIIAAGTLLAAPMGCTGPTKRGQESRELAQKRFNAVRSRVDFDQAKQAFETGNFVEAKRQLESAIDKAGDQSPYWVLLGRIYLETGGLQDAMTSLRKAVELDGENADAHYFLGIVNERVERPLEAVDHYLTALELAPANGGMLVASVDVLIGAGLLDEADRLIRKHRSDFEDDAAVLHLSGRLAMMKKDWTRAADDLEKSVLLDDSDPWSFQDLARAQLAAGRYQACLGTIERIVETSDDGNRDVELLRLQTRCLTEAGRMMEARAALRDLVNLHPEDVQGWIELGLVCLEVEDFRYVLRSGQRIAVLDPSRFEGYFLLGQAAMRNNDLDSAVKLFAKACELAPGRVEPFLALGLCHEVRGDEAAAYRAYARGAGNRPGDPGMRGLVAGVGDRLDD